MMYRNLKNIFIFVYLTCRSHLEDVYDICWSKDSKQLVSGSVDNSAILWDVKKGKIFKKKYNLKGNYVGKSCEKLWLSTVEKSNVRLVIRSHMQFILIQYP